MNVSELLNSELLILIAAAASIGFFHTLFGPDHYLPFIMMSRSGKWSLRKTTFITLICGIGHVLSSVLLGIFGITLGIAVLKLEAVESYRGDLAAWAIIAFGLIYFAWGLKKALRRKTHEHTHEHEDGFDHVHKHNHTDEHLHVHKENNRHFTPWVLFIIFILGPCEPLIPILMYPAAKNSILGLIIVTAIFGIVTIMTMMSIVLVSALGINIIPFGKMEKYTHAIAGAVISICGLSMIAFGL